MSKYEDMCLSKSKERELTKRAKIASDRLGDISLMRDNLDEMEQYYRGIIWQETGGRSIQRTENAMHAAEGIKRSMDVFLEDLKSRSEVQEE